jgi:3-(3-hydroxy-phenyl)propionate hydroxylase
MVKRKPMLGLAAKQFNRLKLRTQLSKVIVSIMNTSMPEHHRVVIAGGGPVGMTLAALLAKQGVKALVLEADDGYCTGSRAICVSRRSQEILAWTGAQNKMSAKGLPWVGGRSYFRDTQVLHFKMPSEPTERFAPMLNIQQFYVEEFAHTSAEIEVRWGCQVKAVKAHDDYSEIEIQLKNGELKNIRADWLIACDGGRSTVREQLGLVLEGVQYEGRYVIVDIEQDTQRPVERLAWFDPPSNPGSTILMHRQPDNVWRIDYQVGDHEDPIEAVKPENVLPRVQSHLTMIGETAPWKPLWISIYNAKCLTLPDYQHKQVLFAGDAAHLVPIFGVRGLNSGLDDAGNMAWKLAKVIQGKASKSLLKTYTQERLHATKENIQYGAKSTEFMAPPNAGFRLLREAALRLSLENHSVSSLINPRQSTPIEYTHSALNSLDDGSFAQGATPGQPAPEAIFVHAELNTAHLSEVFGRAFVALCFRTPTTIAAMPISVHAKVITIDSSHEQAWERYGAIDGSIYLIRPDGYVMARWLDSNKTSPQLIDELIVKALNL